MGAELRPEVSLVSEMEGGGNAVVRLLESDNPKPADVIDAVKFARGASSERSTSNPDLAHLLNDVSERVLNSR